MTYKELKYICERYDRSCEKSSEYDYREEFNIPFGELLKSYLWHRYDDYPDVYIWGIITRINSAAHDLCYDKDWDTGFEESVRMTYEGCKAFDEEFGSHFTDIVYDGKTPQEVIDFEKWNKQDDERRATNAECRDFICTWAENEMDASRQEIEEIYDTLYS
jgi:hypothetical protein